MDHLCRDEKKIGSNGNVVFPENVENIMDGICVKRKVLGQVKEEQQILVSITQRQLVSITQRQLWTHSKGEELGEISFGRKNRWFKI